MQGWLFLDSGFWRPLQAEALLTSVPQVTKVFSTWRRFDFSCCGSDICISFGPNYWLVQLAGLKIFEPFY